MDTTRASLLVRIRDPEDSGSWREFDELYSPLIYRYARARGLSHADAEEIRSSCYETIFGKIRDFEYSKEKGGFKAWLRKIVLNRVIDLKRRQNRQQALGEALPDPQDSPEKSPDELFEEQWRLGHLRFCLEKVKQRVAPSTFAAFELLACETPVSEVADRLKLNTNQVYKAKSRVLALVREQMRFVYGDEIPS